MGVIQINNTIAAKGNTVLVQYDADNVRTSLLSFSLRKIVGSYAGSAVRIRRSSDNAEQDIGFDANGDFDVAAFNAFVGVDTGYVVKWYNQARIGVDATQTTSNLQPYIQLNAYGTKPAIFFNQTGLFVEESIDYNFDYYSFCLVATYLQDIGRNTFAKATIYNLPTTVEQFAISSNPESVGQPRPATFRITDQDEPDAGATPYKIDHTTQTEPYSVLLSGIYDENNTMIYRANEVEQGKINNVPIYNITAPFHIGGFVTGTGTSASNSTYLGEVRLFDFGLANSALQSIEQDITNYYGL